MRRSARSRGSVACLAAVLLVFSFAGRAQGEEWPQWRGPNRDSVWHENNAISASATNPLAIAWRVAAGNGWSSPVVAAGRVILTDAICNKPRADERVRCFDESTGALLWSFTYPVTYPDWAFTPGQLGGPTATPMINDEHVFAVGANGHVHCLAATNGAVLWEVNLRKTVQIADMQCRPSPLIEGKLLILFVGGKPGAAVVALDKTSGKEMWRALDEPVSNSSPLVIAAAGRRQFIVWTGASVTSLDPQNGALHWRAPLATTSDSAIASPVFDHDRLLISGLMLRLDLAAPAASIVWPQPPVATKRILSNTSTPVLVGKHVYGAKSSGELACLDADTGRQVWQTNSVTEVRSGASIHITPCGDDAFLFTDRGDWIRARLSPQGYREISRAHLLEPTTPFGNRKCAWVPPAYANGKIFARNDAELVCAWISVERGQ